MFKKSKKIADFKIKSILLCILFFCHQVYASDAPVVQFKLQNNIPVYLKNIEGSQIDVIYIVIKGGCDYLTPEQSGLETAVFSLLSMGSQKYSYADIQKFKYDTQSSIYSSSSRDGSVFGMTSLSHYFDKTFDVFSDLFLNPAFSQKEYDLLMTQYNQSIHSMLNNPSSMLFYYAQKEIYNGHPYEATASVTPDSIKNISLEAIKVHHKTLLDSRRISVIACGSFDKSTLEAKLNVAFGKISDLKTPLKNSNIKSIPQVKIEGENKVFLHNSAGETGFVMRTFASPPVTSPDYPVASIISTIYTDTLYNVVRENYGACYTPQTIALSSHAPYGLEYLSRVSNFTDFTKYVQEARNIMAEGKVISGRDKKGRYIFDKLEDRLEGYINSYVTQKYEGEATVSGLASRMSAGILQGDDITFADQVINLAKKTTPEDILRVFKKYWIDEPSRWFAVVSPDNEGKVRF